MLLHTNTKLVTPPSQNHVLHVIAVVSNPVGYKSRYRLFEQFHAHMKGFPVHLTTVEIAFGDREFVAPAGHHNVQLRTWDEIWHKENMINLGIARLPANWQYVAWIDGDIAFTNPHWVNQTINALQHNMVVQLFQDAIDLGPDGEILQTHKGFGYLYSKEISNKVTSAYGYGDFLHPGFAWAARREAIDHMGGLMDWAVLGSGDHHMALALTGEAKHSVPGGIHPNYWKKLEIFQDNCTRHIRKDIGYVPGTISHYFHGKKKDRQYQSRWDILTKHKYDPESDIKRDWQGVIQLVDHGDKRSIDLRDDLRKYFRNRQEDSIDLE